MALESAFHHSSLEASVLDSLFDGVYSCDTERRLIYWNQGAERLTGFNSDEVVGSFCHDNLLKHVNQQGETLCHGGCPLEKTLEDGLHREAEVFLHHKDGHRVPVTVRVAPLKDPEGIITGAVEVFADISFQQSLEERIKELESITMVDSLTNLPNRRYLEEQLKARHAEFRRMGWRFGVLFMDIDHFKRINDTYGHDIGDEVLRMVSRTLKFSCRPYDVIGRWGGEEFLGIIPNVTEKNLLRLAERYRILVRESATTRDDECISVTMSVGAALAKPGETIDSLVQLADTNLFACKTGGRDQVCLS